MANEIYQKTHEGLSNLVSPKVASRMLDSALRSRGYSADSVSSSEMREVLLGPVFNELRAILPSEGVERSLKLLVRELKRSAAAPVAVATVAHPTEPDMVVTDLAEPELGAPQPEPQGASPEPPERAADGEAIAPSPTEALDEVLVSFAKIEQVRMVAAVAASGAVLLSRGSGIDLTTLSRLGLTGMRLLARSGELRSYYLAYPEGQLFIFPYGDITLIVIGGGEVNVGSVFATWTKLKEGV